MAELRGVVEIDALGAPVAYHIRHAYPGDWYNAAESMIWDRVPRTTPWGRPIVVHDFDRQRASQNRGLSVLAPILARFCMLTKYDGAELQEAILQTIFATFITSLFDSGQVANALADPEGTELSTYQQMQPLSCSRYSIDAVRPPESSLRARSESRVRSGRLQRSLHSSTRTRTNRWRTCFGGCSTSACCSDISGPQCASCTTRGTTRSSLTPTTTASDCARKTAWCSRARGWPAITGQWTPVRMLINPANRNGFISEDRPSPAACRPSIIASTMFDASRVSRRMLPT